MAKTVLIADDSAAVRLSVRLLLQGRHTELVVREAVDSIDAIRKAKTSQARFDTFGPCHASIKRSRSGFDLLKTDMPKTPVILFTMYTDLQADSICAAMGVDFISKADGVSKLVERVDALLCQINKLRIAAAWALVP